jgi:hypothetical protein
MNFTIYPSHPETGEYIGQVALIPAVGTVGDYTVHYWVGDRWVLANQPTRWSAFTTAELDHIDDCIAVAWDGQCVPDWWDDTLNDRLRDEVRAELAARKNQEQEPDA